MSGPKFLSQAECDFGFRQDTGMTDWSTFLTNINTELVTGRGWTSPSADLYKSPTDAGGRWIDLLFTRISATSLEVRMRDQNTKTLFTRRILLDAGGTSINYYTGEFYCVIDSLRATSELIQAYIAEMTPDKPGDGASATSYGTAFRTTAETNDGGGDLVGDLFAWEDTASVNRLIRNLVCQIGVGVASTFRMGSGTILWEPMKLTNVVGGLLVYAGQPYHTVVLDASIALQTDKTIPVDDSNDGTFRVVGLATNNNQRMAIRKA